MTIGRCDCINKNHKVNLIKAVENEINKLKSEYKGFYQHRKEFNKAFERGDVSTNAEKVLMAIQQNKNSFESTLIAIKSTKECK